MVLGISEILRLVKEKNLVEGLSERELANPEGAGFDLRIGGLYTVKGMGFLGVTERATPTMNPVATFSPTEPRSIELQPNTYFVMETIERVNTPEDILILFRPRTTLFRSGVTLFTGNCSPGYRGPLHFGLINFHVEPFKLELGARIVHAMFYQVKGQTHPYRGQWQGGRLTTDGTETQI